MSRRLQRIIFSIALLTLITPLVNALPKAGDRLPAFSVSAPTGERITHTSIRGKIAIVFFEDMGSVKKNDPLKKDIQILFEGPLKKKFPKVGIYGIFDPRGLPVPQAFLTDQVLAYSKKIGFPVYVDWKKNVANAFKIGKGNSYVFIVDRKGVVRYRIVGEASEADRRKVKHLLRTLPIK